MATTNTKRKTKKEIARQSRQDMLNQPFMVVWDSPYPNPVIGFGMEDYFRPMLMAHLRDGSPLHEDFTDTFVMTIRITPTGQKLGTVRFIDFVEPHDGYLQGIRR